MRRLWILIFKVCLVFGDITSGKPETPCAGFPSEYSVTVKHCPDGWVRFKDEKCFKLFLNNLIPWAEAQDICKQHDSNLASIHSKEELQFINSYFLTKSSNDAKLVATWIGAIKRGPYWTWVDFSPFDFTEWFPGYPRMEPPCVYLSTESHRLEDPNLYGKMVNYGTCNNTFNFICQKYQVDAKRIVYSYKADQI